MRTIVDEKIGWTFDAIIVCRRLGEDNGKDQLVHISNYLKRIRDFVRSISRKLTREEKLQLATILHNPSRKAREKKKRSVSRR